MTRVAWERVARAFRRVALPLASYYAVTLALPLANGTAPSGAFIEHALIVLIVPPVAIILVCAVYTIAHALARACRAFSNVKGGALVGARPSESRRPDGSPLPPVSLSRERYGY